MTIRYYGQEYDPAIFRKRGWRGLYIRLLGRLIHKLQRKLEWHIMRLLIKEGAVPPEQARLLEKAFFAEQKQKLSPEELLQVDRDLRYRARKHSPEGHRGARTSLFFARYMDSGRAGAYRYGRRQRLADPNGDVVQE